MTPARCTCDAAQFLPPGPDDDPVCHRVITQEDLLCDVCRRGCVCYRLEVEGQPVTRLHIGYGGVVTRSTTAHFDHVHWGPGAAGASSSG